MTREEHFKKLQLSRDISKIREAIKSLPSSSKLTRVDNMLEEACLLLLSINV